jgi:hypothetical protein
MSRSTKLGPGGNSGNYNFNKYKGNNGIGATSLSNYSALKRLASFCKNDCNITANITTSTIVSIPETILQYNISNGSSFTWSGATFVYNNALPYYSYTSFVTSIPAIRVPLNTNLINAKIGNLVTTIGFQAFSGCTSLTSITIPNSVTTIGTQAFQSCSSLTSITIPNSVTTIGLSVFSGCRALTSITIPNSVTVLNSNLFSGCFSLTSITIPNSVITIGANAFSSCTSLTLVYISDETAEYLGNQFVPIKLWNSLGTVSPPDFYNAPLTINFQLPE